VKNNEPNLKVNLVLNFIVQFIGYFIPLILAPYVSRTLGSSGVGNYTYAFSFASYFTLFIDFGFLNYGTKTIAENRKNANEIKTISWSILLARFLILIVATMVFLWSSNFDFIKKDINRNIFLSFILLLVGNALDLKFLFQGLEKIRFLSLITVTVNVVYLVLVFMVVKNPEDLLLYTVLKTMVVLVTSIISFISQLGIIGRPHLDFKYIGKLFKFSSIYFIPSIVTKITPLIDTTMIGTLSSTSQVAYYEQANKIKILIASIIYAVAPIILSRVAYLNANDQNDIIKDKITKSMILSLFILLPAVFGLYVISDVFFPLYYGNEFAISAKVMYYLAPSICFSSIATLLLNAVFYSMGSVKKATLYLILCDSANLLTNYFAIKYMGASGAALTSSITNGILLLLCIVHSRKYFNASQVTKSLIQNVIAACVMSAFCAFVIVAAKKWKVSDILIVLICLSGGGSVYFIINVILKNAFTKEIIKIMRKCISRS
jgi:O-antigen/teichoic acid export membrane protein